MNTIGAACQTQRKHRILVVEDDVTQRAVWILLIGVISPNAEIFWADSYQGASILISQKISNPESFDLLISDIFLNGSATGFDICKDYFHQFRGQVVLVSSFGEVETPKPILENFKRTGPVYLKKPLDLRETVSVLRKLLTLHV